MRNEVKLANPNYDSSKIEEFKNVWVFCEQRQGQMMSTSYELISEGRKLADELGVKLCGLLVGDNVGDLAESIGGYGADEVIVCDHPLLKNYTTDAYAKVICDVISEMKPEAFLIGATNIGRDLGPRCAARLHTGLCADCTHLDVDMPIYKDFLRGASTLPEAKIDGMATAKVMGKDHDVSRDLKMTRPAFGGNLMATIICPRFRPSMATVRPGVMKKAAYDEAKAKAVKVTKYDVKLDAADLQTEVVEVVKAAKKLVDLVALTTSSPSAVVSPRTSRAASSSLTSSPTCSAALLAAPVWPSTPAGSLPTIRSVRPVRPSTRRSTLLSVSPAPSSTRPV